MIDRPTFDIFSFVFLLRFCFNVRAAHAVYLHGIRKQVIKSIDEMRIKHKVHAIKLALTAQTAGRLHSALETNSSDGYEAIKFNICFLNRHIFGLDSWWRESELPNAIGISAIWLCDIRRQNQCERCDYSFARLRMPYRCAATPVADSLSETLCPLLRNTIYVIL